MSKVFPKWILPVAGAGVLSMALTGLLVSRAAIGPGGAMAYPLDDTYIHTAMARSMAEHGVWGVTPDSFTSATSSPFWTALLALVFRAFGPMEATPFVLNLFCSFLVLAAAGWALSRSIQRIALIFFVLLGLIFFTPMPTLVCLGMEHTLHIVVALVFALQIGTLLVRTDPDSRPSLVYWFVTAATAGLLSLIRYEGLFMGAAAVFLLVLSRRWQGLLIGLGAVLPVIFYGVWSVRHGWFLFPASVIAKSDVASHLGDHAVVIALTALARHLLESPHLTVILLVTMGLFIRRFSRPAPVLDQPGWLQLLFVLTTLQHLAFARVGWFYRYEAYLVALGLLSLALELGPMLEKADQAPSHPAHPANHDDSARPSDSWPKYLSVLGLVALFFLPLGARGLAAWRETPPASANILNQQIQMGRFVHRFYRNDVVAVNDIGAVAFYGQGRLLDLWGLATVATTRLKLQGRYSTASIADLVSEVKAPIAIVHRRPYEAFGGLPRSWSCVGYWTIPDNVICEQDTVWFYACTPAAAEPLKENLRRFEGDLPPGVVAGGPFREEASAGR